MREFQWKTTKAPNEANRREERSNNEVDMLEMEQMINRFDTLSLEDRAKVLGGVSFYLTIASRDAGAEGSFQEQRNKLLSISELQHKVISQMLAYLRNSTDKYPERDFFAILESMSKQMGLQGYVQTALQKGLG